MRRIKLVLNEAETGSHFLICLRTADLLRVYLVMC